MQKDVQCTIPKAGFCWDQWFHNSFIPYTIETFWISLEIVQSWSLYANDTAVTYQYSQPSLLLKDVGDKCQQIGKLLREMKNDYYQLKGKAPETLLFWRKQHHTWISHTWRREAQYLGMIIDNKLWFGNCVEVRWKVKATRILSDSR